MATGGMASSASKPERRQSRKNPLDPLESRKKLPFAWLLTESATVNIPFAAARTPSAGIATDFADSHAPKIGQIGLLGCPRD